MDATTQQQYAETFHGLHRKGDPLILFNAWDVATAKAIANTSPAVATSSWAVASALGYADGEDVPWDMVTGLVSRMRQCCTDGAHRRGDANPVWGYESRT
jgi:2-methylisocitrate lyase-like PEP mutase family enzyme